MKPDYNDPKIFEPMDEEEAEIMAERHLYVPLGKEEDARMRALLQEAARNTLKKTERTNIRLNKADMLAIKQQAANEGIGYQTLMASILHKAITGQLVPESNKHQ